MKKETSTDLRFCKSESGAALVTVLMATVLLGVACIALLSSVGANSRNSTDVLSETKAYYAAESGLQSTINVLRNLAPSYSQAAANPTLSNWIAYNCTGKVSVGSTSCASAETFYDVNVVDPDNSGNSTTFSTAVKFTSSSLSSYATSNNSNRFTFNYTNPTTNWVTNCQINFINNTTCDGLTNPRLGSIVINKQGSGENFPNGGVRFSIEYAITAPRSGSATISGTMTKPNGNGANSNTITITFDANVVTVLGSTVTICQNSTGTCPATPALSFTTTMATDNSSVTIPIYMKTTAVEPFRLKVLSTGYGPNKAKKQLEAVIQRDLLNGESSPSAFMLQGPVSATSFQPGSSGALSILGQDTVGGISQPSIGVIDSTSLTNVNNSVTNAHSTVSPAPAIVSTVPSWLSTPQKLDTFVNFQRQAAINSQTKRYFTSTDTMTSSSFGDPTTGTGLTFCEGSCSAPGNTSGGGILVVTGTFTTNGAFNFKGLIIITGPGGFVRSGNGGGTIQGSLVLAPYNAASLAANVFSLPPTYNSNGSGNSTVDSDAVSVSQAFNGTNALTDLMLGIAEK